MKIKWVCLFRKVEYDDDDGVHGVQKPLVWVVTDLVLMRFPCLQLAQHSTHTTSLSFSRGLGHETRISLSVSDSFLLFHRERKFYEFETPTNQVKIFNLITCVIHVFLHSCFFSSSHFYQFYFLLTFLSPITSYMLYVIDQNSLSNLIDLIDVVV